jgi:hypothetical protein
MSVWARILIRYLSGFLISAGLLLPDDAAAIIGDPEIVNGVALAIGTLAAAVTETAYVLAKRWGWST